MWPYVYIPLEDPIRQVWLYFINTCNQYYKSIFKILINAQEIYIVLLTLLY
jgi:hypothetical protein